MLELWRASVRVIIVRLVTHLAVTVTVGVAVNVPFSAEAEADLLGLVLLFGACW
jgi:hypothetical protein